MTIPVSDVAAPALPARSARARGRLRQSLSLYLPAGLLILIIAACFLYPLVGNVPPPVGGSVLNASLPIGSPGHLLGTDADGNDIFSRLLYGGRVSLEVGAATQVIGIALGGLIGMIAGFSRGVLAAVLMRVLDIFIAFPSIVLALAIAEGLGIANSAVVSSPTFVLIQEYDARLPIYHFDAYRLATEAEFADLGAHEYFGGDGVSLVEWADKVPSCLPAERLEIRIRTTGETARRFELTAHGARYEELVRQIKPPVAATSD